MTSRPHQFARPNFHKWLLRTLRWKVVIFLFRLQGIEEKGKEEKGGETSDTNGLICRASSAGERVAPSSSSSSSSFHGDPLLLLLLPNRSNLISAPPPPGHPIQKQAYGVCQGCTKIQSKRVSLLASCECPPPFPPPCSFQVHGMHGTVTNCLFLSLFREFLF